MKSIKMIKATQQFQTIIDKYRKNMRRKKPKESLNSLFEKDLNQVKKFNNFSDEEEYMMNEIKNENRIKSEKMTNNKFGNYSDISLGNEKISKDIFFYFRNKLNEKKDININFKKSNKYNMRYNTPSYRIDSGKRSEKSFSSLHTLISKRKKSNASLILPLICARKYNLNLIKMKQNNSRSNISDEETSSINVISFPQSVKNNKTDINSEGDKNNLEKEKNIFLKISKDRININENNFNTNNINDILRNIRIRKTKKELFCKLHLPILQNDIFNKINKVTQKSENINRNINYLYSEGNAVYETEKNKIKFLKDVLNE